ncbi:MAG: hypothetical protein ABSB22_13500, partial [Thermodesulfobacteriota bacterium]
GVASGFGYFVVLSNTFYPIWWPFHNDLSAFLLIFYATIRLTVPIRLPYLFSSMPLLHIAIFLPTEDPKRLQFLLQSTVH